MIGRILLDENMAFDLRRALSDFNIATVRYMGWASLKNGELLTAAETAGFAVFVTGDKTIQFEQNFVGRKIAVVSLSVPHWPLVKNHIGKIALAIEGATPGSFTRVSCGVFSRPKRKLKGPEMG